MNRIEMKKVGWLPKRYQCLRLGAVLCAVMISLGYPVKSPAASLGAALQFNGTAGPAQYVTFGPAPGLGASSFTLELWFKWGGGGLATNTGSGGLTTAIPLLTKGSSEVDLAGVGTNKDMNYFLGIQGGKLAADFEEGAGQTAPSANHPIVGTLSITANIWHHAAATFDGPSGTYTLYLDGVQDTQLVLGANHLPRSDSIQHAALASSLTSDGNATGFFQGALDEVRIWNVARSLSQIQSTLNQEISSAANLIGRWGMNECAGPTVGDSSGSNISGESVNGPTWVPGAPLNVSGNQAPVVDAGPDRSLTLPGVANLAGTATDDGQPNPPGFLTTTWSLVSGLGTVTFGNASLLTTTASFSTGGVYVLRLTATDGAQTTGDNLTVTVVDGGGDPIFVGAGDIAVCSSTGDEATALLLDSLPGIVFTIGDNVYERGTTAEFAACYESSWGRHKLRTRPTTGNHDYGTPGAMGYFDYFNGAGNQSGPAGDRFGGYYSYDLGTWHIVVLNSEMGPGSLWDVNGGNIGSPQEQWLRADLAVNQAKGRNNILAMWHKPRFSSTANNTSLQPLWQALYDYGADIVLTGHWHNYERLAPLNGAGLSDPVFGIREFVVGTGGNAHAAFGTIHPASQIRNSSTFGVIRFILHPNSYDWQFIPIAGSAFTDSGSSPTHGAPVANNAPVVNAGPDQSITFPASASLSGMAVDDGQPNPPGTLIVSWSKFSGPGTVTFGDSTLPITTATFSTQGVYVLRLTANDSVTSTSDDVTITSIYVAPPPVTRMLTINSSNSNGGVTITVSPPDNTAQANGTTSFARTYNDGAGVNLTAPATAGGNNFQKWQRDGADFSFTAATSLTMDADRIMTAIYVAPPPVTRMLTINSSNSNGGVTITVSPPDNTAQANGTASFTRTYNDGAGVNLTAPATAGGNNFQKWQRDGADFSFTAATSLTVDANRTMTAIYVAPPPVTRTLTINSSNSNGGVTITVSPPDNTAQASGTTSFTCTYNDGAGVNLTAPASVGGNNFSKWQRDGADFSFTAATSLAMDANRTMTAIYVPPPPVTRTLTVNSSNLNNVTITVSPPDNTAQANGTTSFTRTYNDGAGVNLTAPASAGGNNFQKWQRDGADFSFTAATALAMDANRTMTAIYVVPSALTALVTSYVQGTLRNDFSGWLGMKITVGANPITVTSLGRICYSGNNGVHALKLVFGSNGADVPGGGVSVNTSGGAAGQFKYAALSNPLTLAANTSYYLVCQEIALGDRWAASINTPVTTTTAATCDGAILSNSGGWTFRLPANTSFGPVNLLYSTGSSPPNVPPTVSLTSPANNATFPAPANITLTATASDSDGTVSKVDFFSGPSLLATAATSPYSFVWNNVLAGNYTLTATATDNLNASNTSTAVTVAVGSVGTSTSFVASYVPGVLRNDFSGWLGMKFTVGSSPIRVTALGRIFIVGNGGTHTVKLVNASNGTDVLGGAVSIAMAGGVAGQFKYVSLANSITLPAGTSYYLVSLEIPGGDIWATSTTTVATTSAATCNGALLSNSSSWTLRLPANTCFGPLSFLY